MFEVRYATKVDLPIWLEFDHHIQKRELEIKIELNRYYVLKKDDAVIGVMRYNLFLG